MLKTILFSEISNWCFHATKQMIDLHPRMSKAILFNGVSDNSSHESTRPLQNICTIRSKHRSTLMHSDQTCADVHDIEFETIALCETRTDLWLFNTWPAILTPVATRLQRVLKHQGIDMTSVDVHKLITAMRCKIIRPEPYCLVHNQWICWPGNSATYATMFVRNPRQSDWIRIGNQSRYTRTRS